MKKAKKMMAFCAVVLMLTAIATQLAGCGKDEGEQSKVDINGVYDTVMMVIYGTEPPSMTKVEDAVQIKDIYGIDTADLTQYVFAVPMMNVSVDTFIGVEAAEGKVEDVKEALEKYRTDTIASRELFPYLPTHLPLAKAAQVVSHGNYVFYVSMGNIGQDVEDSELQAAADAEVAKAVEAINGSF